MSDRVPDLDLRGHFALGPWRVRRAGCGAMQLASDGVFGAAPGSRSGAILPAAQVLPDPGLVVPIVPSMSVQRAVRARPSGGRGHPPYTPLDRTRPARDLALEVDARLEGAARMT